MSDTTIRITDNSDLVGEEFEQAVERALFRMGIFQSTPSIRRATYSAIVALHFFKFYMYQRPLTAAKYKMLYTRKHQIFIFCIHHTIS